MPAGDISQGYIFVPAEKSIDQVKMNAIVGQAYINPAFISAQTESTSSTTGDYFLLLKSGGTLAKIVLDNLASSLAATTGFQSQIWSTRLRSWNSIGNCNMEVDQIQCGNSFTSGKIDRWILYNTWGSGTSAQRIIAGTGPGGGIVVPGTSFAITNSFLRITLTAQHATLAAGDVLQVYQPVEGPYFRELQNDVHSIQVLVRSSVAGLAFGLVLQNVTPGTIGLANLCTLGAANTWTLFKFNALPVFTSSGSSFTTAPGSASYYFVICLAAGTNATLSSTGVWSTAPSSANGAPGQSNFAANTVNSTFDIAYAQHEPGSQCSTLMDCPFDSNLLACQHYYDKSYSYADRAGTATGNGIINMMTWAASTVNALTPIFFKRRMAKAPTVTTYSNATGTSGVVRDGSNGADRTATVNTVSETGYNGVIITGPAATVPCNYQWQWVADTGL
jgi:hypothetical protein